MSLPVISSRYVAGSGNSPRTGSAPSADTFAARFIANLRAHGVRVPRGVRAQLAEDNPAPAETQSPLPIEFAKAGPERNRRTRQESPPKRSR